MLPLKITINLCFPVVMADKPTHLDGMLAWAATERASGNGLSARAALEHQHKLPLERWDAQGQWGYKASVLIPDWSTASAEAYTPTILRKSELELFADARREGWADIRKAVFPGGTGHHKLYKFMLLAREIRVMTAYAVGDAAEVSRLLAGIHNVGRIARNGFGRVASIRVEECADAYQMWQVRNMPYQFQRDVSLRAYLASGGLRPPYWKTSEHVMVSVPALHPSA